ncbi:TRAM domain-containing protein [Pelagibacterium sp. 26DY04]|uniref:class I SAM-dependent RNA methyltransferase n=1 Tax=Pelagibacterium sp. 26DY04 TaxID=2967130 RepID=UPI0028159A51|nr:TRAM domain-containing protein [Pelagibacterium sp. 26DY04]WMT87234.1 TRAM domain-containing protein [Pelagibacterium sp. 26DY04]
MSATHTLVIDRLGHRGEGVALVEGKPIFVPATLPGETVAVTIEGNRGTLLDILAPSPNRSAAPCPHFPACGGCQLQHLSAETYSQFKRSLVVDALSRAGVAADVNDPIIAYGAGRRRATFHATRSAAGFMALRSHQIHDLDRCPILVPALAQAPRIARDFASAVGPCDVAFTASDMGLDVAVRAKGTKANPKLTDLARAFDLARLSLNGEPLIIHRQPTVTMGRAQVPLPVGSFLQATEAAEAALAELVVKAVAGARQVADLFCGVGPFALRLAERAAVLAADSDSPAVAALDAAKRKAKGLKPIAAEKRDLFREPLGPFELNHFDAVVLDPPRAGAQAQIAELAKSKVKTIAYVSCDPQSFARDAATLVAAGYVIGPVRPLDQFAFSSHTEVFARFERP